MLPERLPLDAPMEGLVEFVDGTLLGKLTSAGPRGRNAWCRQWAEHPDAVHRLAAIYDEWGALLAAEDAALHPFIRDVLDYHMPLLVDADNGPFRECKNGHVAPERIDDAR